MADSAERRLSAALRREAVAAAQSSYELIQQVAEQVAEHLEEYLPKLLARAGKYIRSSNLSQWVRRVRRIMRKYRNVAGRLASREKNIVCLLSSEYLRPPLDELEREIRETQEAMEEKCDAALSHDEFTVSLMHQHVDEGEETLDKLECLILELQTLARSYEL
jgi:hypothetical protein